MQRSLPIGRSANRASSGGVNHSIDTAYPKESSKLIGVARVLGLIKRLHPANHWMVAVQLNYAQATILLRARLSNQITGRRMGDASARRWLATFTPVTLLVTQKRVIG